MSSPTFASWSRSLTRNMSLRTSSKTAGKATAEPSFCRSWIALSASMMISASLSSCFCEFWKSTGWAFFSGCFWIWAWIASVADFTSICQASILLTRASRLARIRSSSCSRSCLRRFSSSSRASFSFLSASERSS